MPEREGCNTYLQSDTGSSHAPYGAAAPDIEAKRPGNILDLGTVPSGAFAMEHPIKQLSFAVSDIDHQPR
ncbi:MAG: hypothetical protein M3Z66_11885, partial [Chloroflexota bacterium]|nr:hypothetical protein [Chloroflexota bacterium]